jgi:hypothetical protein
LAAWAGVRPGAAGALVLLALAAARATASATPERVYLLGRELGWGCLFKRLSGLACPACGMTRSVLLTLGGDFDAALSVNPAGPLLVAGLVLLALSLVSLALFRRGRGPLAAGLFARRARALARAYGLLLVAVMFAHWVAEMFVA